MALTIQDTPGGHAVPGGCKEKQCGEPVHAVGLCAAHYARYWRDVNEAEQRGLIPKGTKGVGWVPAQPWAARIWQWRHAGFSQAEIAREARVDPHSVSAIMRGAERIQVRTAMRLLQARLPLSR